MGFFNFFKFGLEDVDFGGRCVGVDWFVGERRVVEVEVEGGFWCDCCGVY